MSDWMIDVLQTAHGGCDSLVSHTAADKLPADISHNTNDWQVYAKYNTTALQ